MKLLGSILLLFAACTISLDILGHGSDLLVIMNRWGAEEGEVIRIAIGVVGFILLRLPESRTVVQTQRQPTALRAPSDDTIDPMAELRNKRTP